MENTVIKVDNLSKKYVIGHRTDERRYVALRDILSEGAMYLTKKLINPFGKGNGKQDFTKEEFWALKDVSFEIQEGDRVGIIGRNGAGKSTLLKILSRITEPTEGTLRIKGRVVSLLEVGTGFHSELTGRENIYLNGAILGMSKLEIKRKFDEIVEFSEIGSFLDTPVKRYSSGMYVRLAFAVAAHLNPEILVVDEVLAVGDMKFQKKCLGKMKDIAKNKGRTVLFVSHNMKAIEQLCTSCMLLNKGQIENFSNNVNSIIKEYLSDAEDNTSQSVWFNKTGSEFNNEWFLPLEFFIGDEEGNKLNMPVSNDAEMWIFIKGEIQEVNPFLLVGYRLYTDDLTDLFMSFTCDGPEEEWLKLKKGKVTLKTKLPERFLNEGEYIIKLWVRVRYSVVNVITITDPNNTSPSIKLSIIGGLSDSPIWMAKRSGLLAPVMKWEINE